MILSSRPSARSALMALGASPMPAPISDSFGDCSRTADDLGTLALEPQAPPASPPIPPPMTRTRGWRHLPSLRLNPATVCSAGPRCQSRAQTRDAQAAENGSICFSFVIAGLDPAIHAAATIRRKNTIPQPGPRSRMDTRVKPAYDETARPVNRSSSFSALPLWSPPLSARPC